MTTLHCPDHEAAPTPRAPRPDRGRLNRGRSAGVRGRRGSAIILVIVSIVLMAVLGATFVQVARFERISTGGEHIDIAIDSVLNEVAVVLAQDLYANNGDFFNPAGSDGSNGGGDEPWDYPFTGTVAGQRPVLFVDGTGGNAQGGIRDDPWLASTAFTGVSNDGSATPAPLEWGHLSDLTGRFLNYANKDFTTGNFTAGADGNPTEVASTAAMVTDIGIAAQSARLVDADGDGIGDSLWAYAPAAEIAGKRYVYAIRIIDLSARVNVNTATGQTDAAGNIPSGSTQSAHGDSPAEVDGTAVGFIYGNASGVGGGTGATEFAATIGHRMGVLNPNWGDANQERRHYWLNSASRVTPGLVNLTDNGAYPSYDPADTYSQGDLFELLYKGGLNNTAVTTQLENDMPNLLRAGSGTETFWGDVAGSEAAYQTDNPRLAFTTYSGVMALAPGLSTAANDPTLIAPDTDGDGIGERVLQVDINHSSLTDLTTVIAQTVSAGGSFAATNFGHVPTDVELGSQLAVNIVDMRDTDNRLSSHNGQFGMEALPFLAEVYVQREYGVPPPGVLNPDGLTYTISYQSAAPSDYAIEIRNPFRRPVDLSGVHLFVGGSSWGELSALTGAPTELGVGEVLLIYANNAAGEMLESGVTADHTVDLSADAARQWPGGTAPGRVPVAVELRAEDQAAAGTALGWGYCRIDSAAPPRSYTESSAAGPLPLEARPFMEISDQGTGTGLNMLQTRPTDIVENVTEPSEARGSGASPALGNANKAFTPANDWDTGDQQWLFLDKRTAPADNDGRIPNVADVLLIPIVGPNDPGAADVTLADAIGQSATTRLDGLMLDYRRAAGAVTPGYDPHNVPHAVLLMERLTTHSPAFDGEDLNGDGNGTVAGTADPDEVFVPGKININTATYDILRAALPLPNGPMRDAVAQQIIDYRDGTGRLAGSRTGLGVAYIGELYEEVQPSINASLASVDPWDWNNDQNPPRATSTNSYLADGITGDREEDLMLAKWLNEVCSTRSDVFAVYMVVQGFPAGNFQAGAVESARVVAVFSRANVRQVGDKAQLVAVRRVE